MFGKGGCVFEIQLKRPDSCFFEGKEPYIIEVVGQGPTTSYTGGGKSHSGMLLVTIMSSRLLTRKRKDTLFCFSVKTHR